MSTNAPPHLSGCSLFGQITHIDCIHTRNWWSLWADGAISTDSAAHVWVSNSVIESVKRIHIVWPSVVHIHGPPSMLLLCGSSDSRTVVVTLDASELSYAHQAIDNWHAPISPASFSHWQSESHRLSQTIISIIYAVLPSVTNNLLICTTFCSVANLCWDGVS
jgi:hypothetical protein